MGSATPDNHCPAFIGYSEYAPQTNERNAITPQRVDSFSHYQQLFGGPATVLLTVSLDQQNHIECYSRRKRYALYDSVRLFFRNGGKCCYVISVGHYGQAVTIGDQHSGLTAGLLALKSCDDINLLLIPDALAISTTESRHAFQRQVAAFCAEQGKLLAIIDPPASASQQPPSPRPHAIERLDQQDSSHCVSYAPWLKSEFATTLRYRDLTITKSARPASLESLDPSAENAIHFAQLHEAIDNRNRLAKAIKRQQRSAPSLHQRYRTLLTDYLADSATQQTSLPLYALLQFLKGLPELINNWICNCALDEVVSGDLNQIIRHTIIPEMANQALPTLITIHQQAIADGMVEPPTSGYQEMFCVTGCIGDNCPWQKKSDEAKRIQLSHTPAENASCLNMLFEQFNEAIDVIIELAEQFENDVQQVLLNHSPAVQQLFNALQRSCELPASAVVAAHATRGGGLAMPQSIEMSEIEGIITAAADTGA